MTASTTRTKPDHPADPSADHPVSPGSCCDAGTQALCCPPSSKPGCCGSDRDSRGCGCQ